MGATGRLLLAGRKGLTLYLLPLTGTHVARVPGSAVLTVYIFLVDLITP